MVLIEDYREDEDKTNDDAEFMPGHDSKEDSDDDKAALEEAGRNPLKRPEDKEKLEENEIGSD